MIKCINLSPQDIISPNEIALKACPLKPVISITSQHRGRKSANKIKREINLKNKNL